MDLEGKWYSACRILQTCQQIRGLGRVDMLDEISDCPLDETSYMDLYMRLVEVVAEHVDFEFDDDTEDEIIIIGDESIRKFFEDCRRLSMQRQRKMETLEQYSNTEQFIKSAFAQLYVDWGLQSRASKLHNGNRLVIAYSLYDYVDPLELVVPLIKIIAYFRERKWRTKQEV